MEIKREEKSPLCLGIGNVTIISENEPNQEVKLIMNDTLADDKTAGKQTNCPAGINFKLKKTDDHNHQENCSLFPLELTITYLHNHSIESANAVKYHEVTQETREKLEEVFEAANSASSAYQIGRQPQF